MIIRNRVYENLGIRDEIANVRTGELLNSEGENLVKITYSPIFELNYGHYLSLNLHFIRETITNLLKEKKLRPVDLAYLVLISQFMDKYCTLRTKSGRVYSKNEISKKTGIDYKTLNRSINKLIDADLLAYKNINFLKVKKKVLIIHPDLMKKSRDINPEIVQKFKSIYVIES